LAYLRDRLTIARELLAVTGSIFVQISDQNIHHVRELLDEVFGDANFCGIIPFRTAISQPSEVGTPVCDYLLWYARDRHRVISRKLYRQKTPGDEGASVYTLVELPDGARRRMSSDELQNLDLLPPGSRVFSTGGLDNNGVTPSGSFKFEFDGKQYEPGTGKHWQTTHDGMQRLAAVNRLVVSGTTLRYVRYLDDYPVSPIVDLWDDTITGSFTDPKIYVVQTNQKVVQRCILMTTNPGDIVLDPTCGSGTTAYVAEQWGRRWVTIDTSRVPLALARQRLITATFPYFELKDDKRGPASGFTYSRRQNRKGEEIGGIVSHVTLKSIANNEPPAEEIIVDRPNVVDGIVRVTGPICVEATIPTPLDLDGDGQIDDGTATDERLSFVDRIMDTLRRAPILQIGGGRSVILKSIRQPAKTLALSAEAVVDATAEGQKATLSDAVIETEERNKLALPLSQRAVAIVFGPENGSVSERLVYEAATEASAKKYTHLYVIGFAIQPNAEALVAQCEEAIGIPATWVPVTPDVVMGDLLRTTRASQIFSVAGRPEIEISKAQPEKKGDASRWQVTLNGLDTFDPVTMEIDKLQGDDVPCWMLDSDYNGRVFHATQVFFPRTEAWDSLKKALRSTHQESVWDHLAGTVSGPFEAGEHRTIAIKVIDDRGNELMVVKSLDGVR
jgi:adenine-specific DNA-methyltransferase